jgi:hypothetical protein
MCDTRKPFIMHKILRIVYGMLKNKTMYDPELDKKKLKFFSLPIDFCRNN